MAADAGTVGGCYGLRLTGIDGAARYLNDVGADAPEIVVSRRPAPWDEVPDEVFVPGYARLRLSDRTGFAEVDQAAGTITLSVRHDYDDEAVLHPLLAGSAAALNHWLGRDSFHAGAVVLGGRAWIVVGDKGDGKSTTLAYLATRGLGVLADDLIVEDSGFALAGPGFIDLRPDASAAMDVGRDIGWLGARMRSRYDTPSVPARVPVAGWISLGWGEQLELRRVPLPERLALLYENRTVRRVPVDPASYVRHAARPFLELVRPKDWAELPRIYDLLTAELS